MFMENLDFLSVLIGAVGYAIIRKFVRWLFK